jgi:hypothetical protein
MAKASDGRSGCASCREYNVENLKALETVGTDNRGRKDERIENVVT